jgi:hypothetical protein
VSEEAVPENGASGGAVSEDAVTAPPTSGQTDEQAENASAESVPAESVPTTTAAGGFAGSLLEVYDNIKVERRLLGIGILALTLIVAILMAMRLPMRRNVEDPAAWGIPQTTTRTTLALRHPARPLPRLLPRLLEGPKASRAAVLHLKRRQRSQRESPAQALVAPPPTSRLGKPKATCP